MLQSKLALCLDSTVRQPMLPDFQLEGLTWLYILREIRPELVNSACRVILNTSDLFQTPPPPIIVGRWCSDIVSRRIRYDSAASQNITYVFPLSVQSYLEVQRVTFSSSPLRRARDSAMHALFTDACMSLCGRPLPYDPHHFGAYIACDQSLIIYQSS